MIMAARLVDPDDLLKEGLKNPEFRERWERTALARAVAVALVKYRADYDLSQKQLAGQLGMPKSQIGRLELGEHNPSVEMLQRLAAGMGRRFILAVSPGTCRAEELPLPEGARVLADLKLPDGGRVLAVMG